ncbi:hypothetical protein Bca52824_004370 [Brassica carinata]|uniref:Uncharacterized protein n=1 Tax=Brassica carinata TaxID=52824 RepID=A0A8X8BFM4_BRACI|nr:hypothetical protein Bca52824_004370 [Brassica carinata]
MVENVEKEGEEFQDLTDDDQEEELMKDIDGKSMIEKGTSGETGKGKEQMAEDEAKKQGVRKKPLKPLTLAGGSTKMRMVQAMLSPRKTNVPKASNRQKEASKQPEEKGVANPKHAPPKN